MTNYYPPSPIYEASYEEEDALTLVNNLISRPTPKEKKDTNMTEKKQDCRKQKKQDRDQR